LTCTNIGTLWDISKKYSKKVSKNLKKLLTRIQMAAGKEIKRLRELQKLSAATVSNYIGVDTERLRKWESRDADPKDSEDINKVEAYFGCTLEELAVLDSFQFRPTGTKKRNPEKNLLIDILHEKAISKTLIHAVAKLNAKVFDRDVTDCLEELEQNTKLNLKDLMAQS
jgi:transcriptional regulator with XRE-family HTH domain